MIRCACSHAYEERLTKCPRCGRARPSDASDRTQDDSFDTAGLAVGLAVLGASLQSTPAPASEPDSTPTDSAPSGGDGSFGGGGSSSSYGDSPGGGGDTGGGGGGGDPS